MNNQIEINWKVSYLDIESEQIFYEIYDNYDDALAEYEMALVKDELFSNIEITEFVE